jgi:hypothetical protein
MVLVDRILHGVFVPKLDESNCFLLLIDMINWDFDVDDLREKLEDTASSIDTLR